MPILGNFPGGGGYGGGGPALASVTNIKTLTAHEKVYIQWTDPDDLVIAGSTLASWGGTLLVRKAGSMPTSRRDGVIVLDSKIRDAYQSTYFCDSGLADGMTYYYKLFPYSNTGTYTDSEDGSFNATPNPVPLGDVSSIATEAAGNGKMSIKWTDPAATVTSDGVTLVTWASTVVVVKADSYAVSPDDLDAAFTYTSTTRNGHASTPLVATGLVNGETYYITLFPMSTDGVANTNIANRKTGVANKIVVSTVPTQSESLTYNANPQSPSWSDYNSAQLVIGGITTGTNAGDYDATFTPADDYMWDDGTTAAKTVGWSIGKAVGSLSLSTTAVTLNASAVTGKVTVTRSGDGAITASSSNTSVATVSVSGNEVTIRCVNQTTGSATITIKVGAGTNHTAPADKTVAVTAQFLPAKKVLNDTTWAEIRQISDAGKGAEYWNVGDCKGVHIKGMVGPRSINQTLYVYILGFNHNSALEGNGIQFGTFKTALTDGIDVCLIDYVYNTNYDNGSKFFNINHWGNYSYGGWSACDTRYDVLGSTNKAPSGYGSAKVSSSIGYDAPSDTTTNPVTNTLMAALPSDLRAVMKPITKYTDNVGDKSNVAGNVTASVDYLPRLAEFEVFGTSKYANQYEQNYQAQYDYYNAGNSINKKKFNETDSSNITWSLRSPSYRNLGMVCAILATGKSGDTFASNCNGLTAVFMV